MLNKYNCKEGRGPGNGCVGCMISIKYGCDRSGNQVILLRVIVVIIMFIMDPVGPTLQHNA